MNACQQRVGSGVVTYACSLPSGHDGPHFAAEVARSRQERERWESGAEARATMAEFQSEAPPVAAPTPVPGTDLSPGDYRRENPAPVPGTFDPGPSSPIEAPCTHPFNQVSPVDGGMYCDACGNVLEAKRATDSLRGFVERDAPVPPPDMSMADVLGMQPGDDAEGEAPDRFADLQALAAVLDARVRDINDSRQEVQEALSTLYQVLLALATGHPDIITYAQVERLVEPIARWVNGE